MMSLAGIDLELDGERGLPCHRHDQSQGVMSFLAALIGKKKKKGTGRWVGCVAIGLDEEM